MSEVSSVRLTLNPQDDPRNITTPIRKNTFIVPRELNLVKIVGDFKLITGNRKIKNNGAVFAVKMALSPGTLSIMGSLLLLLSVSS